MAASKIEWTEETWNPVTGCTKYSDGCLNCYAARFAKRLKNMGSDRYKNGFKLTLHKDIYDRPLHWSKPRMIFVNSMSDLFHEDIPDREIFEIFDIMNRASQHTFQVLTKRSERLTELSDHIKWTENIWMGVSIESEKYLQRADNLRRCGAKIKFISAEPLLGSLKNLNLIGIDWLIVGGESGPKSRPMNEEWVLELRDMAKESDTAFFFKQWGGTQKKKNGSLLQGAYYKEYPTVDRHFDGNA